MTTTALTALTAEFRARADQYFDEACARTDADDYIAAAVATAKSATWLAAAEELEAGS
jgi:hypothetical protein